MQMSEQRTSFYGKYHGKVTDNLDPMMLGRIRAIVPDVFGDTESCGWAMPSVPYAGKGVGLFLIPPVDAMVWIEFEHGDTEYPIWTGCFWKPGEVPAVPASAEMKVLKTDLVTITINDGAGPGGITIETSASVGGGAKIVVDVQGIEITVKNGLGNIKLTTGGISLNDGALEVT